MKVTGLPRAMDLSIPNRSFRGKLKQEEPDQPVMFASESMADIQLSLGASPTQSRIRAMTEKAGNIQKMMQALEDIKERTQGMRSYANELSGTELASEGSNQLFAYMRESRQQLRAFVSMMLAHRQHLRELQGIVPGLADGFRASDLFSIDPQEEDLTTPEGIEKYLESIRARLEVLGSYEGYLQEQMQLLVNETQAMHQDIVTVMKGNGELNPALAMDLASLAGKQLLKGFDILLGLDGDRQKSRVAKLLEMDVEESCSLCP